MVVKVIQSETLKNNVDRLVTKTKKGFFNQLLIFGATRSGKTTIGIQIAHYMAKQIRVSFTVDDIFFSAEKLIKEAQLGRRRKIYMLDEGAFDLMGEDWSNKFQKQLIKLFMVGAKYNQTFLILIPNIEKLREFFIISDHTRAIQTYYNKKTFERGFFNAYSGNSLYKLYNTLRTKQFWKLKDCKPDFNGRFNKKMSYIDVAKYQYKKDKAIKNLGNDDKENNEKIILRKVLKYIKIKYKIPLTKISQGIGKNAKYLSKFSSK